MPNDPKRNDKNLGSSVWDEQRFPTTLPDNMVPAIESKLKEIEDLIYLKMQLSSEGINDRQDNMPVYDPETRRRLPKKKTQTDHLIESRDTLKKILDEFFMQKLSQMHAGPTQR